MTSHVASTPSRPPVSWRRRSFVGLAVLLATGVVILLGPQAAAKLTRQLAVSRMGACEFGPAQRWLARSAACDPSDASTTLLLAACYRSLGQTEKWRQALELAERRGAAEEQLARERKLNQLQSGGMYPGVEAELGDLAAAGTSLQDLVTVFIRGYLAQENADLAKVILERLPQIVADEAHADYLWGVYWRQQGELAEATTYLQRALTARPGHELAHAELAELFDDQGRPEAALQQYLSLAAQAGESEITAVGLAKNLRKLARLDEARSILTPWSTPPVRTSAVEAELAQLDLESGAPASALQRFSRLQADATRETTLLIPQAVSCALQGNGLEAERLCRQLSEVRNRDGWITDLRARLARNPQDRAAAEDLRRVTRSGPSPSLVDSLPVPDLAPPSSNDDPVARTAVLYKRHCRACHGDEGDARGRAVRHLFPRPRNLRTGKMLLVSSRNGLPTVADVERVLDRGMPGTSMPAFTNLPKSDRRLLAEEVLRLRRAGLREQLLQALREDGEEADEAELRTSVEQVTVAGEPVRVPQPWPTTKPSPAAGSASYSRLACNRCHGEDGVGAVEDAFDDLGEPTRARDLVHEPFKGGSEPEAVFLRLAVGMPNSVHPAVTGLADEALVELVEYTRSLARDPPRALTNFDRRVRASGREYQAGLGPR